MQIKLYKYSLAKPPETGLFPGCYAKGNIFTIFNGRD